jgi:phospholipase/carboxylesterase
LIRLTDYRMSSDAMKVTALTSPGEHAGGVTKAGHATMRRRDFVRSGLTALVTPLLLDCDVLSLEPDSVTPTLGLSQLGIGNERDGLLYVPGTYSAETPAPLFVGLHGAGGAGENWASYPDRAEARGMVFLAPDSRGSTWDVILGEFGPDVEFLDAALQYVFDRCAIDTTRIALGGFSDGASYALSLGVSNGDLFSHLVAYSPGLVRSAEPIVGKPLIYVSHGAADTVLPVTLSRDNIVPAFSNAGYDVTYEEFDGGHEVPAAISESALDWFLGNGTGD